MQRKKWLWLSALLLGLAGGCCEHPEIFRKVHTCMEAVQSFYEPLIQQDFSQDEGLRLAVVAADTTLLLAGELQRQWCPDPGQARQLELQVGASQKLAQEAGVPDALKERGN